MMRNPVHSRFCSSSAPSPHRNDLPGAENSGSENTSPTVEKALMLKSPPVKSRGTAPCTHVTVVGDQWKRHVSWPQHCGCAQSKNVTVGVPEREGRRSSPRTMSGTMPHVPLLVERLKGVLVEQDGEVRVASVRNELNSDVRDIIACFLKANRMKPSASRCNDVGGVSARWAWVPLKNWETVLMMHEITVRSINVSEPVRFGMDKSDHGVYQSARLWKRYTSRTWVCTDCMVGSC